MSIDVMEKVKKLVALFGYDCKDEDIELLEFSISESCDRFRNFCNIREITIEHEYVVIRNSVGLFLRYMKNSGKLDDVEFNFNGGIKSISEGDTSVTYEKEGSYEERFDILVKGLCDNSDLMQKFRKVEW